MRIESRRRTSALVLGLIPFLALGCSAPELPPLPPGGTSFLVTFDGVASTSYGVRLKPREVVRIRVDQDQVDVLLELTGPNDLRETFDGSNGSDGPEWLIFRSQTGGDFRIDLTGRLRDPGRPRAARVSVETFGNPLPKDLDLHRAYHLLKSVEPMRATPEDIDALRNALDSLSTLPDLVKARLFYELGKCFRYQGRPDDAVHPLKAAAEGFQTSGNAWEEAPSRNHLAYVLTEVGRLRDAEEALVRAFEVGGTLPSQRFLAASWVLWGNLQAGKGRHAESLRAYRRAEQLFTRSGSAKGLADCRHNIGNQLLLLGELEAGIDLLREAETRWSDLDFPFARGRTLLALSWGLALRADLLGDPGDVKEAFRIVEEAVEIFKPNGSWELALALEFRGARLLDLNRPLEALADLERAASLTGSNSDEAHNYWIGLGMGPILSRLGRLDEAREVLGRALAGFEKLGHHQGRLAARVELARVERLGGRIDSAARRLDEAIVLLETPRAELRSEAFRRSYLAVHREIYEELTDLWAERALSVPEDSVADGRDREASRKALFAAERGKARSLLDHLLQSDRHRTLNAGTKASAGSLRNLEAQSVLPSSVLSGIPATSGERNSEGLRSAESRPSVKALRRARTEHHLAEETTSYQGTIPGATIEPWPIDAVYPFLDGRTEVLLYSLGRHRSWLFRVSNDTVDVRPLPPRREIERAARRAHYLLPRWDLPGHQTAARSALDKLARTVLPSPVDSSERSRWVVVPDGALHWIPFGVLPGPDGAPLIENLDIVHLPSLSALHGLRQRRLRAPGTRAVAVIADPVFGTDDPRLSRRAGGQDPSNVKKYLPRLPASGDEAETVARLADAVFGESSTAVFRGFEAKVGLLRGSRLHEFRMLHIATHGLVQPDVPALAGLAFSLFRPDGQARDGFLSARDLYGLEIKADLVVLSACRSGSGREVRGEGLVGLVQGFFAAGTRHLVVTLWDVDDRATAKLMERYYHYLLVEGTSPDRALRSAQNDLRRIPEWSSPRYWAGFIALGDWELFPPEQEQHPLAGRKQ